jgi:hypothetical protein
MVSVLMVFEYRFTEPNHARKLTAIVGVNKGITCLIKHVAKMHGVAAREK